MAHWRPASRHGRYEAFRTGLTTADSTADELPSQSVFNYDGTEDVQRTRENPVIRRQVAARRRAVAQGVVPSGPVVAVHMFNMPADRYEKMSLSGGSSPIRPGSQESDESYVPCSPHPPASPQLARAGSALRRSFRENRPSSSRRSLRDNNDSQEVKRPLSARRSSRDFTNSQEDVLPPMTVLRPQSSLGKYHVLPDIGAHSNATTTSGSDGSSADDQRGTEEIDGQALQLTSKTIIGNQAFGSDKHRQNDCVDLIQNPEKNTSHNLSTDRTKDSVQQSQRTDSYFPDSSAGSADIGTRQRKSSMRVSSSNSSSSTPSLERSRTSISQYKMDEAPQPTCEGQILLGIKIPTDGTRQKQYFNVHDQLRCIVLFAEEVSGEDFSNHILVLANPRKSFPNLSQTIGDAGIENKSVIHLEELD